MPIEIDPPARERADSSLRPSPVPVATLPVTGPGRGSAGDPCRGRLRTQRLLGVLHVGADSGSAVHSESRDNCGTTRRRRRQVAIERSGALLTILALLALALFGGAS